MVSYTDIIDDFKIFSENHPQIESFGTGKPTQISTKDTNYPLMFVSPVEKRIEEAVKYFIFDISVLELLNQDDSNITEIMNRTDFIIDDIIAHLYNSDGILKYEVIDEFVTADPYLIVTEASKDDYLNGWNIKVEIALYERVIC